METSEYEAASAEAVFYARMGLSAYGGHILEGDQVFRANAITYFRHASCFALAASQLAHTQKERKSQERRVFAFERFRLRVEAGLDFIIG